MADWSEDDWDSSSSVGSPSSSLPQSIRDILESVRAECNASMFGGPHSSCTEKPSVTKEPRKELVTHELAEVLSPEAQKGVEEPSRRNIVEGEGSSDTDDSQNTETIQSQEGLATRFEPMRGGILGRYTGTHQHQEDLSEVGREKINFNGILAGYRKANAGGWIKIDGHTKKPSVEDVKSLTENHPRTIDEPERLPALNSKGSECVEILEQQTQVVGHDKMIKQDDLKRSTPSKNDLAVRMNILDSNETEANVHNVKLHHKPISGKDYRVVGMSFEMNTDQRNEKIFTELEQEDSSVSFNGKTSISLLGNSEPFTIQSETEVESADGELQTIDETLEQSTPTKRENLHKELGKHLNMHDSKDVMSSKRKYREFNSGYKGMEDFAKAYDCSQMTGVGNIKVERFSHDEINLNSNISREDSAEFDQESWKNSLTMWRQELLSSDFNLIYGSLRAVLMRNLSKDDRHRLVQTMIETMSELEEVIMGEEKPVQHSVRCETPEVGKEFDDVDEERANEVKEWEKDDSGSNKKMNTTLRRKATIVNKERMRKLMKECPDGTAKCLVCKKTEQPKDRVCRACSTFTYRVERNYTLGIPIPTCDHINYAGAPTCKSCRYRKFSFMSMTETRTRLRRVRMRECPVCKRISYHFRGWKCTKCEHVLLKFTQRNEPVNCAHTGEYPVTCDGCRYLNFQIEWLKREPVRPCPLPLVQKNLIKCEK